MRNHLILVFVSTIVILITLIIVSPPSMFVFNYRQEGISSEKVININESKKLIISISPHGMTFSVSEHWK